MTPRAPGRALSAPLIRCIRAVRDEDANVHDMAATTFGVNGRIIRYNHSLRGHLTAAGADTEKREFSMTRSPGR
jgi:hypothetical protein